MKLRLPHKFQAALVAAIASVSFTTVSSGTLGAAAFLLSTQHAAAQDDAYNSQELNYNASVIEELSGVLQDLDEEKLAETETPANAVGTGGVDDILQALNEIDTQEVVSPMAAGENAQPASDFSGVGSQQSFIETPVVESNGSEESAAPVAATYTPALAQAPAASAAQGTASTSGSNFSGLGVSTGDSAAGIGSANLGITGGGDSSILAAPALLGAAGSNGTSWPTVSFTGGTTYAAGTQVGNYTLASQMTTGNATAGKFTFTPAVNITGANFRAGDYTLSLWVDVASLKQGRVLFIYGSPDGVGGSLTANALQWDAAGSLTLGRGNMTNSYAGFTFDNSNKSTISNLTLPKSGLVNFTLVNTVDQNGKQNATLYLNGEDAGTFAAYNGNMNGGNKNTVMGTYLSSSPVYGNISLTNSAITSEPALRDFIGFQVSALIWAGSPSNVWQDGNGAAWQGGTVFHNGDIVVFDNTATNKQVLVNSDISAGNMTVNGEAYTFSGNGTLTTDSLTIADGASLALTNGNTLAVSGDVTLSGSAALSLASGTTLKLSSGAAAKQLMMSDRVANNGTFEIATNVTLDNASTTRMGGTLKIDSGVELKLSQSKDNPTSIASFSEVILAGGTLWSNTAMGTLHNVSAIENSKIRFEDYPNDYVKNLTKLDGITSIAANKTLEVSTNYKSNVEISQLTGAGTLSMTTVGRDDSGEFMAINSLEGFTGNISLAPGSANNPVRVTASLGNADVSMGTLSLNSAAGDATAAKHTYFKLTGEHNLTLKGIDGTNGEVSLDVPTLTLDVADTHSYTGTLEIGGTLVKKGSGKQTLSGFTINETILLQGGTLELTGAYNLDNLQLTGGSISYENGQGIAQGSGFKKVTDGTLDVVNRTSGVGAKLTLTDATFTYNGAAVTVSTSSGDATVNSVDYTTLWVNGTGSVSYNAAQNIATQHTATVGTVHLNAEGATITMDKAAAIDLVMTSGISGTVHATAATTLNSITGWEKTLTISGTETVTLPSGDIQLTGTQKLAVEGKAATGKLILNSADAELAVAKNGKLSVTGNLTPTHGTVNINGTVSISNDLDLSNGNKSDATMVIGGTGQVTAAGMWMCSTSTLKLQEGGQYTLGNLTFTGKGDDTSIAANDNTKYGAANANFTITHAQVTANANSTIKNKLVNTSVVAGTHTVAVENAGNTIAGASVSEGGSFTMTSGTLTDVVTSTGGTVALSGITLGDSFEQQGGAATYVDLKGAAVTASDNYYLGNTKGYVTVVTGTGEFSGSAISWGDETYSLETDGTITTKKAGTDYTTFYINRDSEQISDILEHGTESVQVNAGTLVVNQDASGIAITVSTEGTITGEKADAKQVDIQKDAVAHYTGNVEDSAVKFTAEQGKTVDITNKGDEGHKYSIDDAGMHVVAQKMELSEAATGDVVVNNHVSVETVENLSTHALTLNDGESEVKNVFATHGDIKFHNTGDAIALENMTIGEGKQVGAYTGTAEMSANEATVSISNMLTAGKDASLYANLVLESNSTLNLGGHFMYLGSELTLQEGLIQFDEATLAAIAALDMHQTLNLFQAADGTQLSYSGVSNEDWARTHFDLSSITDADYKIVANDYVFGIEKVSNVPEPATGTLSLLALAALAARRRRKN